MRLHVVSDVHRNIAALSRAGVGADALVCLGDLLLFVDYADHSQGIFADQISQLFHVASHRAGLSSNGPELTTAAFRRPGGAQLALDL